MKQVAKSDRLECRKYLSVCQDPGWSHGEVFAEDRSITRKE